MTEEEFNNLKVGNIVISSKVIEDRHDFFVPIGVIGMVREFNLKDMLSRVKVEFWGIKPAVRVYPEEIDKYNG